MAMNKSEKLIARAKAGEKLSATQRRACVAYLLSTQISVANTEAAEIFQVSERQIRKDKDTIRRQRAKFLKEDDVALIVGDIISIFERQAFDMEQGKQKCTVGSRTYLDYCKAISDLNLRTVKALQDLGYYPKNLGTLSVERFDFKATVAMATNLEQRPVHMSIEDGDMDAENQVKLLPSVDDILDAQFEDVEDKNEDLS